MLCQYIPLDYPDKNGHTPVHAAALGDNLEALKIMIDSGGDPFVLNHDQESSLDIATMRGFSDIVFFIIQQYFLRNESLDEKFMREGEYEEFYGWNRFGKAMILAGKYGHPNILKHLVGNFVIRNRVQKSVLELLKREVFAKLPNLNEKSILALEEEMKETKKYNNLGCLIDLQSDLLEALAQGQESYIPGTKAKRNWVPPIIKFLHSVPQTLNFENDDYTELVNRITIAIVKNEDTFNNMVQALIGEMLKTDDYRFFIRLTYKTAPYGMLPNPNTKEIKIKDVIEKELQNFKFGKFIGILLEGDHTQIGNKDKEDGGRDFFPIVEQAFDVIEKFIEMDPPGNIDIVFQNFKRIMKKVEDQENEKNYSDFRKIANFLRTASLSSMLIWLVVKLVGF